MTLLALVKVGSRYEAEPLNGAAHFIEHLMFKGTKKRPSSQIISQELDRYGAEYNAYTGKDITGYYIKMEADKTEVAVDMLHDMLFHSIFEPDEVERERNVILEEINMYDDNPRDHIADLLEEALFYSSSLSRNIAGTRKTVKAFKREHLKKFYQTFYIPERITLVLAGKIVPHAEKIFKQTFGAVPRTLKRYDTQFAPFKAPQKAMKPLIYQNKKTEQMQLSLGFYGLPFADKRRPAAALLGLILGGSMSSRLFIEIRERRGLCYAIRASHEALEDTGIFTISSGLDKSRMREAISAIYSELDKIKSLPVLEDELERAKENVRGRMLLSFEDSAAHAEWYGRQWHYEKNLQTPEQRLKLIQKVTPADIQRVASVILKPEQMTVAAIGPIETKQSLSKIVKWK